MAASLGDLINEVSSGFNFAGMEYRDFRDNIEAPGLEEEPPRASYADATANGGNRGGRRPPRPPLLPPMSPGYGRS